MNDFQATIQDVRERYAYAAGDRVEVEIGDRAKWWSASVAAALEGKRGVVEEVIPKYEIPCVGTGVGEVIPAFRVALDEEVRIDDGRTFSAFHFRADELRPTPAEEPAPRGRADYAERVERRRERLETGAAKAGAEFDRRIGAAHRTLDVIPMGQPILVGHHSEKRHRRDLARAQANLRAGFAAKDRAEDLSRAADAVGTAGISSDDPEAVTKLRAELADLEARRVAMKAGNAAWKKAALDARPAIAEKYGVSLGRLNALTSYNDTGTGREGPYEVRALFPSCTITNLGANIRRVAARIEELQKAPPTLEPIDGGWYRIEARPELNRIALTADRRLPKEAYLSLKSNGWRWSPTESAFLTNLTNRGIYNARDAHRVLSAIPSADPVPVPRGVEPPSRREPLESYEVEVRVTYDGAIRIGMHVGANAETSMHRTIAGISAATVEKWRAGGVVERIVEHETRDWVSVLIRYPDGSESWEWPSELEARGGVSS